ncbi:hypothetical protein VaNZ11_004899 [Volvox africanus]|uniref:C2 domain-containing protein n=1 Tax=Volvox africanus TaxID=51714 RepID=A0ABQ5RXF5_9CHLO|nr:hypothetical protein VaNZ11_004899 [Volvox africanus]
MVQVAGSSQAASPSVRLPLLRLSILNPAKRCRRGAPCLHFAIHQQPQSPSGLPSRSSTHLSPRSSSSFQSAHCACGSRRRAERSVVGHAGSSSGASRGGGPKQWSGSWASVTGSYRGSYDEAAGDVSDELPEGSADEVLRGRAGKLLALGGAVSLELLLTGSLVWTPLAAAVVALVVLPGTRALTAAQAAAREAETVARAEARVRAEMAARVPVSPPESAVWMGRLMGELWQPFVQPLVLRDNLDHWADKVRRAAPAGLELQLEEMSLGTEAPQLNNFQVLADPASGRVTAINCDMAFDSSSMRVVVSGSGPLGRFTATMAGINMRGRMRLLPIPDKRIILFSFREPPTIDPKMTLEGPFLGARDIPPTSLVRSLLAAILQDCLVEPVRAAISLDPAPLVGQPIDTTVHIYVESVQGIRGGGSTPAAAPAGAQVSSAPSASSSQTSSPVPHPPQSPQQRQSDEAKVAAFLESLASGPPTSPSAAAAGGSANSSGGGGATAAVVAAASNAAVAASEAVVEGAGAIASLVPGLSAVAGSAAAEGPGRGPRQRMLQVVAINTDSKLQRETTPVPYKAGAIGSAAASEGIVVPVLQMLKLNVGHKDTIYKLLVKDVGRSGLVGSVTSSSHSPATATTPSAASSLGPPSPSFPPSGSTSSASSTPTSVAAAMVTGLPTPGLLGSVRLHVAAARDGSTLFWAAGLGGEPVAVRWRPSDGPWRVTLPLESPAFGLPPPAPQPGAVASGMPARSEAAPAAPGPTAGSNTNGGVSQGAAPSNCANGKASDPGRSQTSAAKPLTPATAAHRDGTSTAKQPPGPAAGAVSSDHIDGDGGSAQSDPSRPSQHHGGAPSTSGGSSHDAGSSSTGPLASGGAPSITLLVSTDPWVYKDAARPRGTDDSPRPRSLVLQVVEARELAAHDWAGTCDPYVRISYNGRTYRTRTLYNAHTPVWQQTFILADNRSPSSLTRPARNRLSLAVYDSGVSRDDRLGSATLNLDMASDQLLQDRWIPLQGVESGRLRVRLAAVPDSPDSPAVRCIVEALQKVARGMDPLLQVVVMSARALSPRRNVQLLGLRDAYCNVVYGGARHVTPVVRQSQTPPWHYSAIFVMQHPEDVEGQEEEVKPPLPVGEGESERRRQVDTAAGVRTGKSGRDSAASGGAAGAGSGQSKVGGSQMLRTVAGNRDAAAASARGTRGSRNGGRDVNATAVEEGQGVRNGIEVGSSADPAGALVPYPPIPGALGVPELLTSSRAAAAAGGGPARPRPRPRFRRGLNRDLLRLEVKDVAPVPPDEDLGWVELPVRALLPQPGDSWQGWLPLRRGEGAELLVRISRIEPIPMDQDGVLLPMLVQQQQQVTSKAAAASSSQPQGSSVVTMTAAGGAGGDDFGLTGTRSPPQQAMASMEKVLLDSFTDQVRAANRSAGQVGQDLRVRLGQDVIPKIQDWWEGALQRTVSTLEPPSSKVSSFLRSPLLLTSSWLAGKVAISGKPPSDPQRMLPSPPPATSQLSGQVQGSQQMPGEQQVSTPGAIQDIMAARVTADDNGKVRRASSSSGNQRAEASEVEAGASMTTAGITTSSTIDAEASDTGENSNSTGQNGLANKASKNGGSRGLKVVRGTREADGWRLGQLVARAWEQLLGPPAYQAKPRADDSLQPQQKQQERQQEKKG